MPPRYKKALTYKCLKCNEFIFSSNDREELKNRGFEHQITRHELVTDNRDWYYTHVQNYFDIS